MIARKLIAARRTLAGEAGTSLVELMVVVGLLGTVMAVALGSFGSLAIEASGADNRLQNLDEARVLMAVASKDLRTATPLSAGASAFILADAKEVTFYAYLDPSVKFGSSFGPNKVHIYVDVSNPAAPYLVEELTKPDVGSIPPAYTYTGAPAVRFVGKYVYNGATQPIFTYYDGNGAVLGPTPLSAANMLAVKSIGIQFLVRKTVSNYLPATTLVNRVTLPNLYYNPGS
jgi:type II secretory pathway pseudopilin PulG